MSAPLTAGTALVAITNDQLDPFEEIGQSLYDEAYRNGFADANFDGEVYDLERQLEGIDRELIRDGWYEGNKTDFLAKVERILAALPTRDEAALPEAVAWVVQANSRRELFYRDTEGPEAVKKKVEWLRAQEWVDPTSISVQPLYAAPPPPVTEVAGGVDLHPATAKLVSDFATALAEKLAKAERKYGYTDGWLDANWEADCREALLKHIEKGDPRDVAAYCAFMWFHKWSTSAADRVPSEAEEGR